MPETSPPPKVAIVGAGISGLTAALRLAERGYKVTVFEEKPFIGGNLGSRGRDVGKPRPYDIYPHLYPHFYLNFWELVEKDLGLKRGPGEVFEPRASAKVLDKGSFPDFKELRNVGSFETAWANLWSGVASPADMFLWAYSLVDMLSWPDSADDILDKVSMDGFVRTRPYATEAVSDLYDDILMTIWSIHAEQTSMAAYRHFVQPAFRQPKPFVWLLTGDLKSKLLDPLQKKLEALGCEIHTDLSVREVILAPQSPGAAAVAKPIGLMTEDCWKDQYSDETQKVAWGGKEKTREDPEKFNAVILALPPKRLASLAAAGKPEKGPRLVELVPQLSQTRRLDAEPVVVVDLYFNKKLEDIPEEHVLLRGSDFGLTLVDLSQLWHDDPDMKDRTVLTLAASDFHALPVGAALAAAEVAARPVEGQAGPAVEGQESELAKEERIEREATGLRMIQELSKYLPEKLFRPGDAWGKEHGSPDIDWELTHIRTNTDAQLFVNIVGGKAWQPRVCYPKIPNVFFAGDCTINDIRMATVESAVVSGLQAAQELCKRVPTKEAQAHPVEIKQAGCYSALSVLAMKTLLAPWVYPAMSFSTASELIRLVKDERVAEAQRLAIPRAVDLLAAPLFLASDWWFSAVRAFLR